MATKHHNSVPIAALMAILAALAIGSAPVATLLALNERLAVMK